MTSFHKISSLCLIIFILLNLFIFRSNAFVIANPNICYDSTEYQFGLGYTYGHCKIYEKSYFIPSNTLNNLRVEYFYVEQYKKIIKEISLFLRAGKGFGFGVQVSLPKDNFSLNFTGCRGSTDTFDGLTAMWASFRIKNNIYIYSGISKLFRDTGRTELYRNTGGFIGTKFVNKENFSIVGELHTINENTANISLSYDFNAEEPIPIKAYLPANPEQSFDSSAHTFKFVKESGYRKISEMNDKEIYDYSKNYSGTTIPGTDKHIKLRTQRGYFQIDSKSDKYLTSYIRLLSVTGADFEYLSVHQDLGGMGVGVQISLPEFNKSLQARTTISANYSTNIETLSWTEYTISECLSYRHKRFSVYGGMSFMFSKIFLKLREDYQTHWRLDNNLGGLLGIQYYLNNKFDLKIETHFINEYIAGINLEYNY